MTDVNQSKGTSIIIRPDDTSISVAQAIYHHITAKSETISELFRENYEVSFDDLLQLYHSVAQTAQRHHQGQFSCTFDHAIYKRDRARYTSFDRFQMANRNQPDSTAEMVLTYDFLTENPFAKQALDGFEIKPERYKVTVTISQEHSLSMADIEDENPAFLQRLSVFASIRVVIEYVDYTVARSLLESVREWCLNLETRKRPGFVKFITKHQFSVSEILPALMSSAVLMGFGNLSLSSAGSDINNLMINLTGVLAVSVVIYALGQLLCEAMINALYKSFPDTIVLITRGDQSRKDALVKKQKRARRMAAFWAGSVVFVIAINILSNYIYDKFKAMQI